MSGENWRRPTTVSLDAGVLERIDTARGGTPRSRWIEATILEAMNAQEDRR